MLSTKKTGDSTKWYFTTPSGGRYGPFETEEIAIVEADKWVKNIIGLVKVTQ